METKYRNCDNATGQKRILSVTIKRMIDDCPDTSWLGEYNDDPSGVDTIDRQEQGDWHGYGEYRYFHPAMTGEETGNPESPMQDYRRMESLNRGDWQFLYIVAECTVQLGSTVCQTLTSGGLAGIESDSDPAYLSSVESDELQSLAIELEAIGFSKRQIKLAFSKVEKRDE